MVEDKQNGRQFKKKKKKKTDGNGFEERIHQKLLDKLTAYGDELLGDDPVEVLDKGSSTSVAQASKSNGVKQDVMREGGEQTLEGDSKKRRKKKWEDVMELASIHTQEQRRSKGAVEKRNGPEIVVYEERKKKVPRTDVPQAADSGITKVRDLSHEVYQFGLSGFDYEDKEKMEMQRAIRLGAKPPKNEYLPYKELMKQQKEMRQEELKQREIDRKMGLKVKKRSASSDPKRSSLLRKTGFWQDPSKEKKFRVDGQVGRYRQGIQVLSRQDIHKIKTNGRGQTRTKGRRKHSKKSR